MVREHLPERLKDAGSELLVTTDALGMEAQGAMWLYDHALRDWRYYLVTSLVDMVGRRKTYQLLIDAFAKIELPQEMTVEDVHLGSPNDPLFLLISSFVQVAGGPVEFTNCSFNGVRVDGVMYRAVKELPNAQRVARIEKRFAKRVKDLPKVPVKSRRFAVST